MKVLVLSSTFPNPRQPALGVFVQERMRRVARESDVVVAAPVPWFPFNHVVRQGPDKEMVLERAPIPPMPDHLKAVIEEMK